MTAEAHPRSLELPTDRGPVACAYHEVPGATAAVLAVGGTDGGLDGPADALYPDLGADLAARGISTLRLDFRLRTAPGLVPEGVFDVQAGLAFLRSEGSARVGLVGHSFGGAVVIDAGAQAAEVVTVATLASQTAGTHRVAELAPRALLLIHGLDDIRLSPDCSRLLYQRAGEPKRLELLAGARHSLRQNREEVRRLLLEWLEATLPVT